MNIKKLSIEREVANSIITTNALHGIQEAVDRMVELWQVGLPTFLIGVKDMGDSYTLFRTTEFRQDIASHFFLSVKPLEREITIKK